MGGLRIYEIQEVETLWPIWNFILVIKKKHPNIKFAIFVQPGVDTQIDKTQAKNGFP